MELRVHYQVDLFDWSLDYWSWILQLMACWGLSESLELAYQDLHIGSRDFARKLLRIF